MKSRALVVNVALPMILASIMWSLSSSALAADNGAQCAATYRTITSQILQDIRSQQFARASLKAQSASKIATTCKVLIVNPGGLNSDLAGINLIRAGEYAHYAGQAKRARTLVSEGRLLLIKQKPLSWIPRLEISQFIRLADAELAGRWPAAPRFF